MIPFFYTKRAGGGFVAWCFACGTWLVADMIL